MKTNIVFMGVKPVSKVFTKIKIFSLNSED